MIPGAENPGPGPWQRNPTFEAQFLEHVLAGAGVGGYLAEGLERDVRTRLEKGAAEYGAEGYLAGGSKINEILEEPADVIGWSTLEVQRLYLDEARGLPREVALEIRAELIGACQEAARAWVRVRYARELLERYNPPPKPSR